jgi:hypothetical protein
VGVPAHQLGHDAAGDVVDAEGALGVAQLGLEDTCRSRSPSSSRWSATLPEASASTTS